MTTDQRIKRHSDVDILQRYLAGMSRHAILDFPSQSEAVFSAAW